MGSEDEKPLLQATTWKAELGFYDDWKALLASTDLRYDGFVVPTRDALYTIPAGFVPLYRGASVVVVGVNHVLTQNASYQMFAASVMEVQGPDAGSNVVFTVYAVARCRLARGPPWARLVGSGCI